MALGAQSTATAQAPTTIVSPGDTVKIPLPVQNSNDSGDTINNVQVTIVDDPNYPGFATNITPSAKDSILKATEKTFTPSFVVGNVSDGPYTVTLKTTIDDVGIDPDPDDPAQYTQVTVLLDASAPRIQLLGSNGLQVPPGGTAHSEDIRILVIDHISGPGKLEIRSDSPDGQQVFLDDADYAPDRQTYGPITLPNGVYYVKAQDQAGNEAVISFTKADETDGFVTPPSPLPLPPLAGYPPTWEGCPAKLWLAPDLVDGVIVHSSEGDPNLPPGDQLPATIGGYRFPANYDQYQEEHWYSDMGGILSYGISDVDIWFARYPGFSGKSDDKIRYEWKYHHPVTPYNCSAEVSLQFYIDPNRPQINFTNPASPNGQMFARSDKIQGVATDDLAVCALSFGEIGASQYLFWNGAIFDEYHRPIFSPGFASKEFAAPLAMLEHGHHHLRFEAIDCSTNWGGGAHVATKEIEVDIDAIPPELQILNPSANAVLTSLEAISGTAADTYGVASVKLQVLRESDQLVWDGGAWVALGDPDQFPVSLDAISGTAVDWTYSGLPASELKASKYRIRAMAIDRVGNRAISQPIEFSPQTELLKVSCDDSGYTGEAVLNPLTVQVMNYLTGKPEPDVTVEFSVENPQSPPAVRLETPVVQTDAYGIASTIFEDIAADGIHYVRATYIKCTGEVGFQMCRLRVGPPPNLRLDQGRGGPHSRSILSGGQAYRFEVNGPGFPKPAQVDDPVHKRLGALKGDRLDFWYSLRLPGDNWITAYWMFDTTGEDVVETFEQKYPDEEDARTIAIHATVFDRPTGADLWHCDLQACSFLVQNYLRSDPYLWAWLKCRGKGQIYGCRSALTQAFWSTLLTVRYGEDESRDAMNSYEMLRLEQNDPHNKIVMDLVNQKRGREIGQALIGRGVGWEDRDAIKEEIWRAAQEGRFVGVDDGKNAGGAGLLVPLEGLR